MNGEMAKESSRNRADRQEGGSGEITSRLAGLSAEVAQPSDDGCVKEAETFLQLDGDHIGKGREIENVREVRVRPFFPSLEGLPSVPVMEVFWPLVAGEPPPPRDGDVDFADRAAEFDPADRSNKVAAVHIR